MKTIALIGNPNSGKSTLFNLLSGLNQKIGNFPGVTVEKYIGNFKINDLSFKIVDFPGTYSINPKSLDEEVVFSVLSDTQNADFPDQVLLVADSSNLKRSLFIATQIIELGIPTILILNMEDLAAKNGIEINVQILQQLLGIDVIKISARCKTGIDELKLLLVKEPFLPTKSFVNIELIDEGFSKQVAQELGLKNSYAAFHYLSHYASEKIRKPLVNSNIEELFKERNFDAKVAQRQEAILRYKEINAIIAQTVSVSKNSYSLISSKIDRVLTHKYLGLLIFALILFGVFQTIYNLSQWPMAGIGEFMTFLRSEVAEALPKGMFNDLMVEGVLAGLEGIVIFIPQIALLFGLIALLEESGYMSRVSYLMDKLMRPFGLNGRSVIPMIGGIACAVPSILSARTIGSHKERLLTILVTPLMSCSARLPVYTLMISLVIPQGYFLGFIGYQGAVLLFLYFIGLIAALAISAMLNVFIKDTNRSLFVFELPPYRIPRFKAVGITIINKIKDFLQQAGGIILAISIVLWALASFGPKSDFDTINNKYNKEIVVGNTDSTSAIAAQKAERLESSFAGILGKKIEPFIEPLGFDWKIGIALITSFAAREVFVGTMNTIYSVSGSDTDLKLYDRMKGELRPGTQKPLFDLPTGFSLMIFYAFAMQCMSTLAVVKSETKSWKWPIFQFVYMGALAYGASFIAYKLLTYMIA